MNSKSALPNFDPLVIVVSKPEVESLDTSTSLSLLSRLYEPPETAGSHLERVDIAFHG